ncbi:MAG: DEAD/DEAH box helicase [Chitinophagales bacterium]|nr:DEAD/DEAH box helicase [Chitinophagales bacterium]
MEKFRSLGLSENVLAALQKKGWETPSPIQEKTIPLLLSGVKDIVGQAQTGTGKTAAFGLPLIEKLDDNNKNVQALILCPTRELAIQVAEEITSFRGEKKFWVLPVYGGQSYQIQERGLKKGAQIVVGTPGRIRDMMDKRILKLDHVTHVVLDEADEMLNMGFEEEVREILKSVPTERRMLLFSATMPAPILKLAKTFMGEYDLVEVEKTQITTDLVDQIYFEVNDRDRFEALCRIIDTEPEFYGIVFCRTKNETDIVADKLIDRGYDSEGIHGDVTQSQRELILKKFKMRKVNILVATDVAARGIDVNDLTHVVNYNLPQDPEAYVHRIGRTGRAGKHGTAITIIAPNEMRDLLFIQKIARSKIRKDEVPTIADVIETKRMKLKTEITELIEKDAAGDYLEFAKELLEEGKQPENVLASLLSYALKDTLKPHSYREISSVASRSNTGGNNLVRLFVAKGHMDRMNAEKVAAFVANEAAVDANALHDIRVFDKFSFISAPAMEAEQILVVFGKNKRNGRSLVTRAKEKDGGGGRSFSGGGGGYKKFDDRKPKFDGERKRYDDRSGDKNFGERKSFGEKREGGERKKFSAKPEFKKDFAKTETGAEQKPRKRENKLTTYLDKQGNSTKPEKKKKQDTSELDKFMKKFDDDLSW